MKKKAIEKIPYFGLKKTSRKKDVKYIGVTAVKIVGHEKHLFLEVYRNKKKLKDTPVVRIVTTKKDFGTYYPEKDTWTREKIEAEGGWGRLIWQQNGDASGWQQIEKESLLQSAEDLERLKKFCKGNVWNENRWWEYIYNLQDDIVTTARWTENTRRICAARRHWQIEWRTPKNCWRKRSWTELTDCIFTISIICITKSMVAGHI